MSPEIDIGQIEGSYVFGLGLWTSEEIKFHPKTGKSLTFDTWVEYNKPTIMYQFNTKINIDLVENINGQ